MNAQGNLLNTAARTTLYNEQGPLERVRAPETVRQLQLNALGTYTQEGCQQQAPNHTQ